MQTINDQNKARYAALEKLREHGINPYPAEKVPVSMLAADFTTKDFHANLKKRIEKIQNFDANKVADLVQVILDNRFNGEKIAQQSDLLQSFGLAPSITVEEASVSLADFVTQLRVDGLGDFGPAVRGAVVLAGRFMGQRGPFAKLQDSSGSIQLYLDKKGFGDSEDEIKRHQLILDALHIGDFIAVEGTLFSSGTGEVSLHVDKLSMLSKSLRTLPIVKKDKDGKVYDAFTDPELRFRMRYVDLVVNEQVKSIFLKRSKVINSMRNYFTDQGWIEVETPVLQPIHGGAAARPFATHHNVLDMPLYLRIANELYLKRLIVGGFDGVFEFGKMFRNEGMDRTHNPEFTSMEIYVAYKDYIWMMEMVEECLERVAIAVNGSPLVQFGDAVLNFAGPYERLTMYESIEKYTGVDISEMDEQALRSFCKKLHIDVDDTMGRGKLIDEIFGEKVEANLIQPTYITDYPIEMTPLAKKHRSKEGLVERFELFVNGKEIANAYSELNDPIDQRERFEDQLKLAERGDDEAMALDEDFLRALEYGMPPTSGLGIGIDRLTMLLTNNTSIQEVLFFPQMKPERKKVVLTEQEKIIFDLLNKQAPLELAQLKEQTELSNKQWDKGIKGLTAKNLAKVVKDENGLLVHLMEG